MYQFLAFFTGYKKKHYFKMRILKKGLNLSKYLIFLIHIKFINNLKLIRL